MRVQLEKVTKAGGTRSEKSHRFTFFFNLPERGRSEYDVTWDS